MADTDAEQRLRQLVLAGRSCADVDPAVFYENEAAAKQVCAQCPVALACLLLSFADSGGQGLWGGMDPAERRAWARALLRPRAQPAPSA